MSSLVTRSRRSVGRTLQTISSVRVDRRAGEHVMNFVTYLQSFVRDDEGQDLVEYAMLVALIALVCVVGVTAAGTSVNNIFSSIGAKIVAV
jgi:pilus assembly protein Flp/PilA